MKIDLHPPHPCPPPHRIPVRSSGYNQCFEHRRAGIVQRLGAWSVLTGGIGKTFDHLRRLRHPVPIVWGASWIPRPDFGELVAAIFAFVASFERKRTIERVLAGLERARANGTTLGRPRVVVNREKVWRLRDSGRSIRDIAGSLKLSHGTVKRIA